MKPQFLLLAVGLLAGLPFSASAKIERVVEKSFTVTPGGLLTVETQGGNIHVASGSSEEVKVTAKEHFRANSEAEADEIAKHINLRIEQSGADVSAGAKFENDSLSSFWRRGSRVEVEFVVTVPAKYRAHLRTSGGNIGIGDLGGDVDLRTSGGDIRLGKIDGEVVAETSGGTITIDQASRRVKAHTSGGDVRAGRLGGEAQLSTSGGNIQVEAAAGRVQAETSGGNVSATFVDALSADCVLKTSGGNVNVKVNPNTAFRLDASTSGGDVRVSGLTIEVQHGGNGKSSLVALARGGGPELKLRTSGGDVRVSAN